MFCNCFHVINKNPPWRISLSHLIFGVLIKYWSLIESAGLQWLWFHSGPFLCFVYLGVLHLSVMIVYACVSVCLHLWVAVMLGGGVFHRWKFKYIQAFGQRANMPGHNVTKEFLMERRARRKRNEWFWVKALDILSSLNTPLGVSANVTLTSGCGQTA